MKSKNKKNYKNLMKKNKIKFNKNKKMKIKMMMIQKKCMYVALQKLRDNIIFV